MAGFTLIKADKGEFPELLRRPEDPQEVFRRESNKMIDSMGGDMNAYFDLQNKWDSVIDQYKEQKISQEELTGVVPVWYLNGVSGEKNLITPFIDPIDAVAGPIGFARKVGMKVAIKAVGKALLTEPIVGGAMEYVDEKMTDLPPVVRGAANILTGIVVGDLTTNISKNAKLLKGLRPTAPSFKMRQPTKSAILQRTALSSATNKPITMPIDVTPQTLEKSATQQAWNAVTELYQRSIGKPVWDNLIMKQAPKLLEHVPGGKPILRGMDYKYRGGMAETDKFIKMREDMNVGVSLGADYAIDIGSRLQKYNQYDQLKLGEYIRGELKTLPRHLIKDGDEAKNALYVLGHEATKVGLLSEETFFKNVGRYMPRLYTTKEYTDKLRFYGVQKPERLDLSRFRKRKDIPKEIRQEMGEILTPGYPVAKGIAQLTSDIHRARFFNGIASNSAWAIPYKTAKSLEELPKTFRQLPKNKKLGALSEAYVHPEIYKEINDSVKSLSLGEKTWLKTLGLWKFGKVILSPKTHMRNMFSNAILGHMGGMPLTAQPKYLRIAADEMAKGGDYWRAAKQAGLLDTTFIQKEMGQLFDNVKSSMKGLEAGSIPESVGLMGNGLSAIKTAGRKASDLYQAEEQWFKMAKFIHNIEKRGMGIADAAEDAEKWLFNYGKLSRFQDKYRKSPFGAPFATFTFKALPRVMETAVKYPWRFAVPWAMIEGLQAASGVKIGDTPEQQKAKKQLLPEWMQGWNITPNFARMPILDDEGREYYLNLTYMLPWGDLGESGEWMGIPGGLRPLSQPFTNELAQQIGNYDFFWHEPIVKEEDTAGLSKMQSRFASAKKRIAHFIDTLEPTIVNDVQKGLAAWNSVGDYRMRLRPKSVVAADTILGIKMYPVDYAEQAVRYIMARDPKRGEIAANLKKQIKTLVMKQSKMEEIGNHRMALIYQKQIDQKNAQILGIIKEAEMYGELYEIVQGEE